jgi:hypothetical protein
LAVPRGRVSPYATLGALTLLTVGMALWSASTSPRTQVPPVAQAAAPTTFTTVPCCAPSPADTIPSPVPVATLGGTIVLNATTSNRDVSSPDMPLHARLAVTLEDVVDPADSTAGSLPPGDRWVEAEFGLKNEDTVPFTDPEPPDSPPISFVVDNTSHSNEDGAPPLPISGYQPYDGFAPSPMGPCGGYEAIAPGGEATDCVGFQLPFGVPAVLASVAMTLVDSGYGTLGEWRMPPPNPIPTGPGPISSPSLQVGHVGETFTLTAPAEQLATGVQQPVLDVTVDGIVDPDTATRPPDEGDHWAGVRVTISNVGNTTLPCYENYRYQLSLDWDVDADPDSGGQFPENGLVPNFCAGVTDIVHDGLAPGQSITAVDSFELPIGVPVANVFAGLGWAGEGDGTQCAWLVP